MFMKPFLTVILVFSRFSNPFRLVDSRQFGQEWMFGRTRSGEYSLALLSLSLFSSSFCDSSSHKHKSSTFWRVKVSSFSYFYSKRLRPIVYRIPIRKRTTLCSIRAQRWAFYFQAIPSEQSLPCISQSIRNQKRSFPGRVCKCALENFFYFRVIGIEVLENLKRARESIEWIPKDWDLTSRW